MHEQLPAKHNDLIAGNLDTSFLKVLALVFMLTDHIGAALLPQVLELRVLGRIAFPLYAWCLVVGSVKTKAPIKYFMRLLGLAAISQPLYMMALNHTWRDMNILFTLSIALVALTGIEWRKYGSHVWLPLLCYIALGYLKVDYGWKGLTFILLLYFARDSRTGLFATMIAFALYWGSSSSTIRSLFGIALPFASLPGVGQVLSALFKLQGMIWLAIPFILFQTHSNIRMPKWLGYALYPLHLIVLIVLRLCNGATFQMLFKGF